MTLRWSEVQFRRNQTYTYTNEGDVFVHVSGGATPYDSYGDNLGTPPDSVSSEHHAQFADCTANCEWSRTLTFNSK